jgi:hypothetical protein
MGAQKTSPPIWAAPLLRVVDELFPTAFDDTGQDANNRIENDHGRLKERLRPMRCLRTDRSASNVIRGHAFVQTFGAVTAKSVCKPVTNASSRGSLDEAYPSDLTEHRRKPNGPRASIDQRNRIGQTTAAANSWYRSPGN